MGSVGGIGPSGYGAPEFKSSGFSNTQFQLQYSIAQYMAFLKEQGWGKSPYYTNAELLLKSLSSGPVSQDALQLSISSFDNLVTGSNSYGVNFNLFNEGSENDMITNSISNLLSFIESSKNIPDQEKHEMESYLNVLSNNVSSGHMTPFDAMQALQQQVEILNNSLPQGQKYPVPIFGVE